MYKSQLGVDFVHFGISWPFFLPYFLASFGIFSLFGQFSAFWGELLVVYRVILSHFHYQLQENFCETCLCKKKLAIKSRNFSHSY